MSNYGFKNLIILKQYLLVILFYKYYSFKSLLFIFYLLEIVNIQNHLLFKIHVFLLLYIVQFIFIL